MLAGKAVQGAANVQLPFGQLIMLGMGAFAVSNPEKFLSSLQSGMRLLLLGIDSPLLSPKAMHSRVESVNGSGSHAPIVIHQINPSSNTSQKSNSTVYYLVQLALGAGFCWGSYVVLTNVLPETAKGLLPVTTSVFSHAVTSLGTAVLNLRDHLMDHIMGLKDQQTETHENVVELKDKVDDVQEHLNNIGKSVDQCRRALSDAERRTSYIARGVQLLTRGVSTILSHDDDLLHELMQFNSAGDEVFPLLHNKVNPSLTPNVKKIGSSHTPVRSKLIGDQSCLIMESSSDAAAGGNSGGDGAGASEGLPSKDDAVSRNDHRTSALFNLNSPAYEKKFSMDERDSMEEVMALLHRVRT
jgi:hypothetical protein